MNIWQNSISRETCWHPCLMRKDMITLWVKVRTSISLSHTQSHRYAHTCTHTCTLAHAHTDMRTHTHAHRYAHTHASFPNQIWLFDLWEFNIPNSNPQSKSLITSQYTCVVKLHDQSLQISLCPFSVGERRLSYKALKGALMIYFYRWDVLPPSACPPTPQFRSPLTLSLFTCSPLTWPLTGSLFTCCVPAERSLASRCPSSCWHPWWTSTPSWPNGDVGVSSDSEMWTNPDYRS